MSEALQKRVDELEAAMLNIADALAECTYVTVAQGVIGRAALEVLGQLSDGASFVVRDRALEIAGGMSAEIRAAVGAAFAAPPSEMRQ